MNPTHPSVETEFDFSKMDVTSRYKLMVDLIIPRPIAFVSTRGLDGSQNLAPFSFFNGVSSSPPCLMISCTPKRDGTLKDTLRNILETREFVVNGCTEEMVQAVHQTSFDYEYGIHELPKVGLHPLPSKVVKPLRVAESPWSMECRLFQHLDVGTRGAPGSSVVIIGEILFVHQQTQPWSPLARLGGAWYGSTQTFIELERPKKER